MEMMFAVVFTFAMVVLIYSGWKATRITGSGDN
jgi:hypothetical protein